MLAWDRPTMKMFYRNMRNDVSIFSYNTVGKFLEKFKMICPDKDIWIYTGNTIEEILAFDKNDYRLKLAMSADVIVDGPFVEELRDAEVKVLIAFVRANWVSYQLTQEKNFDNQYYDSTTRTYSKANMLAQLNKLHDSLLKIAKQTEYDYNRVALDGTPQIGKIE